jgi:hypothetical protein
LCDGLILKRLPGQMRKIRGSAQDLACSFADPNKLQNDVVTERCISKIWQFGDTSD